MTIHLRMDRRERLRRGGRGISVFSVTLQDTSVGSIETRSRGQRDKTV
jgi:hypothetical protein